MIPDLAQSLSGHDLRHLQIVAELWGIELEAESFKHGLDELIPYLLTPELLEETLEILPEAPRLALSDLQENGGLLPWALFSRSYGEVRQMGRGRRERELPHRNPYSAAEVLWYRALLGRAFFDAPGGPEEFAYIPSDLQPLLEGLRRPLWEGRYSTSPGRRARKEECEVVTPATDRILDHACTLLAGLRLGLEKEEIATHLSVPQQPLQILLTLVGLLDDQGMPRPEETGNFLKLSREEGLLLLTQTWRSSQDFIEMDQLPHLVLEGEWEYDPLRGREAILAFLSRLPADTWWSLASFVDSIRLENPDFQRPAGDYDSWFIRHRESGAYLRGFEHWDDVDGAYIYYLLTGPLHWLGVMDLASVEEVDEFSAIRLSHLAGRLLVGEAPADLPEEKALITVRSDGQLAVPFLTPRAVRYQIARFCAWEDVKTSDYRYRLTGQSLEGAREQGLRAGPILALLSKSAESIPPNISRAIERWDKQGAGGQMEQVSILRLANPEILKALRKSRAARFLGDPLSPTTVIVKDGAGQKVMEALAELGYFGMDN